MGPVTSHSNLVSNRNSGYRIKGVGCYQRQLIIKCKVTANYSNFATRDLCQKVGKSLYVSFCSGRTLSFIPSLSPICNNMA